jgi:hypothetical protein
MPHTASPHAAPARSRHGPGTAGQVPSLASFAALGPYAARVAAHPAAASTRPSDGEILAYWGAGQAA